MTLPETNEDWWTVALSEEVTTTLPFAAAFDGVDCVLFRDTSGAVRALRDQCAHRRAPLSLGKVTEAGLLECPYHGWRYDGASGACKVIPNFSAGEKPPAAYRVAAYRVRERDGFIQVSITTDVPDDAPDAETPASYSGGPGDWSGSRLVAYPAQALADLLLNAPSAVLAIDGVTVLDEHRYGDPRIDGNHVVVSHAAIVSGRGALRKVVADYPLSVKISAALDGRTATVEVNTDAGAQLALGRLAFTSIRPTVVRAFWRGQTPPGGGPMVTIRGQIDPELVKNATEFASSYRRLPPGRI